MTPTAQKLEPNPGSSLAWQILAPVTALFFVLILLLGLAAWNFFEPLALERDLLRAERYAKTAAVVFSERLPGKTSRELLEEFWAAGLDTLEFLPPGQSPSWSSPRYLTVGPYVEAWAPVKSAEGSVVGALTIRRQADAVVFATGAIRTFAAASCIAFALLAALAWILLKRRVTDRLDAIVREIDPRARLPRTGIDAVEEIHDAIAQKLGATSAQEKRLRYLLDSHTELACIATPEGTLIETNAAYCRFFGKRREDLIGTSCLDLVHPSFRMDVISHLRSVSNSESGAEAIHALTRPDGSTSWVKWHAVAAPGPDGRTKEIISLRTDITTQVNTEERLKTLQRAFDQMQSLAETGSLTWDFAADRMEWTTQTRRLLGLETSARASIDGLLAVIAPDEREAVRELFLKAKQEGRDFEREFRAILPDGSLRILQSRAEVLADPKTKLLNHLTCTLRDITALRDAEAATKRELRFREAIEHSLAAGIVVSDEDGKNLLVNPAFCEMTGWSQDELVGITAPYPYWPEEEIPAINKAFAMAISGATPPEGFELTFCRKDGTRFDVLVKVAPLLDSQDRRLGWLGAVTDISLIQRTRRELAAAEKELRAQLSYRDAVDRSANVALIAIGQDGSPISANTAYCKLVGFSEEEILAWKPPYPCWPEEDRENIQHAFDLHLEGNAPVEGFQIPLRKKNGDLFDVIITVSPILTADGKQLGLLSALTDVTPLQQARRELLAANERLRIAQEVVALGIWDWDPSADTLFWDKNSFALFGHPEAADPKSVWGAVHSEEERERLTHELKRLIASGGKSGQDNLIIGWPDGSVHEILSTYVILRDASGHATRVIGVNRDVTVELEREREMRNAHERLTAALEGGSFGTFEHIIGVGDLNWNHANYEINGIDPSITEPHALFEAWKETAGDFFPKLMAQMDALPCTQNHYTYEFAGLPAGKEPRRIRVSIFIERNKQGHAKRLVGVSRRIDP